MTPLHYAFLWRHSMEDAQYWDDVVQRLYGDTPRRRPVEPMHNPPAYSKLSVRREQLNEVLQDALQKVTEDTPEGEAYWRDVCSRLRAYQ